MRLFLAGAETWFRQMVTAKVNNILFSYFYMRSMRQRKLNELFEVIETEQLRRKSSGEKPMTLFLDSGGFTYLMHDGAKPPVESYAADLIGFVRNTAHLWNLVAELDIDDPDLGVADSDDVERWRNALDEATGCAGKVVHVWHPHLGRPAWTAMCKNPRFPYLALGSDNKVGQKPILIAEAHRHGKKVHGFAETKLQTDAKYLKYDSVDSTTWLRATKYGGFFVFQNNRLRIIDHKHKGDRRIFRTYFQRIGIDMDKILREDQEELTKASLIVWRQLADRYEAQGAHNRRHADDDDTNDRVQLRRVQEGQGGDREATGQVQGGHARTSQGPVVVLAQEHRGGQQVREHSGEHVRRNRGQDAQAQGAAGEQDDAGSDICGGRASVPSRTHHTDAKGPGHSVGRSHQPLDQHAGTDRRGVERSAGTDAARVSASEFNSAPCADGIAVDASVGQLGSAGQRRHATDLGRSEGDEHVADHANNRGGRGSEGRGPGTAAGTARPEVAGSRHDRVVRMAKKKPILVLKDGVLDRVHHDRPPVNEALHSAGPYDGLVPADPATWAIDGLPRCIAARNTGHAFTAEETRAVDAIGERLGCFHCGAPTPGEEDGTRRSESRWIKDHLPATDDLGPCIRGFNEQKDGWEKCQCEWATADKRVCWRHMTSQVLVPSCQDCSLRQGGGRNTSKYTQPEKPVRPPNPRPAHGGKRQSAEDYRAEQERLIEQEVAAAALEDRRRRGVPDDVECEMCADSGMMTVLAAKGDFEVMPCLCQRGEKRWETWKMPGAEQQAVKSGAIEVPQGQLAQEGRGEPAQPREGEGQATQPAASFTTSPSASREPQPSDTTGMSGARETAVLSTTGISDARNTAVPLRPLGASEVPGPPGQVTSNIGKLGEPSSTRNARDENLGVVRNVGARTRLAMAKVDALPGVVCSNCAIGEACPKFEEGSVCAFGDAFGALQVRNLDDLHGIREVLVAKQRTRVFRAILQEDLMAGGQIDPRVSQEMDRLLGYIGDLEAIRNAPPPAPVSFSAQVSGPDGVLHVQGSGQRSAGIISKLFGAPLPEMPNEPARGSSAPVDTTAVPTDPPKETP